MGQGRAAKMTTVYLRNFSEISQRPYFSRVFHVKHLLPMQQNRTLTFPSRSSTWVNYSARLRMRKQAISRELNQTLGAVYYRAGREVWAGRLRDGTRWAFAESPLSRKRLSPLNRPEQ